jgi:phosphonate transport system substrate-binding protein
MVPAYVLSLLGATPEEFFRRIVYTHGLAQSIRAVTEGLVDGASVDGTAFDLAVSADPALARHVRAMWRSAPFGNGPVVAHVRLASTDRERLARVLNTLHRNPAGKAVLRRLGFDRFEAPDLAAYRPLETMLSAAGVTP